MKHVVLLVAVLLLALLFAVQPALAKGDPQRVTLAGPGLSEPLEILDPDQLVKLNPFVGTFLDTAQGPIDPLDVGEPYEVVFYYHDPVARIDAPKGTYRPFYRVEYYPGSSGGRGVFFDSGDGTTWLPTTGRWFYATQEVDTLFQSLLMAYLPSLTGAAASAEAARSAASIPASALANPPVATVLALAALAGALAIGAARSRARRPFASLLPPREKGRG